MRTKRESNLSINLVLVSITLIASLSSYADDEKKGRGRDVPVRGNTHAERKANCLSDGGAYTRIGVHWYCIVK